MVQRKDQARVVAYVDRVKFRKLRAALALEGLTMSEWVRHRVDGYLEIVKTKSRLHATKKRKQRKQRK